MAARPARMVPFGTRAEAAELPTGPPTLMAGARSLLSHGHRRAAVGHCGVVPFPGVIARAGQGRIPQHRHRYSVAGGGSGTAPAPPVPVLGTAGGAVATASLPPPSPLASWVVSPARRAAARRCLPLAMVTWTAVAAVALGAGAVARTVAGGGQACAWRPRRG